MNLDEDMNLGQEMKFINMDIIIVAMPVTANTRIVHCVQKTTLLLGIHYSIILDLVWKLHRCFYPSQLELQETHHWFAARC